MSGGDYELRALRRKVEAATSTKVREKNMENPRIFHFQKGVEGLQSMLHPSVVAEKEGMALKK